MPVLFALVPGAFHSHARAFNLVPILLINWCHTELNKETTWLRPLYKLWYAGYDLPSEKFQ